MHIPAGFQACWVVLVLSEDQFPGRRIPGSLKRQQRRGLEILWTKKDMGSYKKLCPPERHTLMPIS